MSTNGTTTFSKQQIQQCQEIVQNLRVHELHQLLSIFHYPKLGKKQELVQRAQTVLSNPKYQAKAAQKVLEIQASNRIREAMHPYSPTGNINGSMHPPYSGAVGGPMSAPVPASSSPSVIAGGGGMLHPGSAAAAASGMARGSGGGPATFSHQQQMFANANAAAYAANLVAYQHQFFQHLPSHNFGNTPAPHHHPQPHPLMAAAAAAAAAAQQQHHHQQNGQPSQQLGAATAAATGQGGGQQQQQPQHVQNQFQQQQQPQRPQQQPAVVPQHRASGQLVRDLRTVELPFYDQIKVIVPMTELPPYPVPTRPGDGRATHSFAVPSEDIQKVHYRSEEQPLPRYELQLRMFLLETSEEQQDAFPPGSVVRLDEYHVGLPPVIPTNKPNAEQKRYPRPVNITPYAQPPRSRNKPHCLNFEWNGDKRAWAFTVTLVKRLNSEILLDRILKNPNARRPLDRTKQTIIRRLNGDEDDVQMDSMKTSLMDPLMRTRIKIPSRAADCTHLQCFDLNSYLMMSEKRPTWKCPVCDKNAIYSKLIIDTYFEQVLSNAGAAVDEVELLRDGSWRLPLEHDTMGVESEEEKFGTALAAAAVSGGDGTNAEDVNANAGGDDDDDDIMVVTVPVPKKRAVASAGAGGNEPPSFDFSKQPKSAAVQQHQPPAQQLQKRMPSSSSAAPTPDIDIICLSSDDEEAENRQMARAIAASSRQQQLQQHHHQMMLGALGGGNNKNNVDGTYRRSNSGGGGCAAGTSSSSTTSNGGGDSSSTSSSSANASAAPTTAQNGQSSAAAAAPTGVVPEAVIAGGAAGPVLRSAGDRAKSIGSAYAASPTSVNNTPMLRVNGVHPPIFRPTIDEVAKRQIAHNLALFLQHVCAKNNKT